MTVSSLSINKFEVSGLRIDFQMLEFAIFHQMRVVLLKTVVEVADSRS